MKLPPSIEPVRTPCRGAAGAPSPAAVGKVMKGPTDGPPGSKIYVSEPGLITAPTSLPQRRIQKLARCLLVLWSLALGAWTIPCQAVDTNAVLDSWFAAQSRVRTWSADFTQTRTLKTLTQPLVTQGHLAFAAPNEFRWELGRPTRTMALRSGDDMFVVYPLLKRGEHYSLGESTPKPFGDTISLLQAGFPLDRQKFAAQFQILSLTQTNEDWLLELQPKSEFARQMMPKLWLGVATNDFSLASTVLVFLDGSRMRSDFTNAVLNAPLDSSLFKWIQPADFKITSPLTP